MVKVKEK